MRSLLNSGMVRAGGVGRRGMLEDSLFRYKGAGCDMVVMWFSCGGGVLKGNGDFARGVREGAGEIKGSSLLGGRGLVGSLRSSLGSRLISGICVR